MSTVNNQVSEKHVAPHEASRSESGGGALFQRGMSGLTTAALLEVQKMMMEIANLEGEQFTHQVEASKEVAQGIAKFQTAAGVAEFNKMLVGGLMQIGGSVVSLGITIGNEIHESVTDRYGFKEIDEQLKGIKNYKDELNPEMKNASIDERKQTPAGDQEIEMTNLNKQDRTEAINKRLKQLNEKDSFIDENNKAVDVATTKGEKVEITDQEVIKNMKSEDKEAFEKHLDREEKRFIKLRKNKLSEQGQLRQSFSTASQGISQMFSGAGTAGSGKFAEDSAKQTAASTEAQAALQGLQQVSGITQGQFTKLSDAATAINQNIAAIAQANALV